MQAAIPRSGGVSRRMMDECPPTRDIRNERYAVRGSQRATQRQSLKPLVELIFFHALGRCDDGVPQVLSDCESTLEGQLRAFMPFHSPCCC